MAATKVTKLWTAFAVLIVRLLAALGFRTPATASTPAAATAEDTLNGAAAVAVAGTGTERDTAASPPGPDAPGSCETAESGTGRRRLRRRSGAGHRRTSERRTAPARRRTPSRCKAPGRRKASDRRKTSDRHATPECRPAAPAFLLPRMPFGRTLPPTMKQRIRAEAHGAAPSSRSVLGDAFDTPYSAPRPAPYAGPVSEPPARVAAVPAARAAAVLPAARRPERELCPA
ncbi:DUF6344 domain-containing protein [Streptomyces sp. NPDC007100]|uniref:DUF6344 domain-containing protein n=1 Tax=Streptomyces sp. NPDC007100 TaxID=3155602 RepID=UPI0033D2336A